MSLAYMQCNSVTHLKINKFSGTFLNQGQGTFGISMVYGKAEARQEGNSKCGFQLILLVLPGAAF